MTSPAERNLNSVSLPPHESVVPEDAICEVIDEIVEAKQAFAATVRLVTGSIEAAKEHGDSKFSSASKQVGDVEGIMRGPLSRVERANGMVLALDKLAAITDGTSWDEFTDQLSQSSPPETS